MAHQRLACLYVAQPQLFNRPNKASLRFWIKALQKFLYRAASIVFDIKSNSPLCWFCHYTVFRMSDFSSLENACQAARTLLLISKAIALVRLGQLSGSPSSPPPTPHTTRKAPSCVDRSC